MFAYIVNNLQSVHADAFLLGWLDDCTERTFGMSMRAVAIVGAKEVQARRIVIDFHGFSVSGFFRGIDPIHVEWRLQDPLLRQSMDFPVAVCTLKTMWRVLNTKSVVLRPGGGAGSAAGVSPTSPQEALHVFMQGQRVAKITDELARGIVAAYEAGDLLRLEDGARPPRPYVAFMLRLWGHGGLATRVWPEDLSPPLALQAISEALDDFEKWFAKPMAKEPLAVRTLPLKQGPKWRYPFHCVSG